MCDLSEPIIMIQKERDFLRVTKNTLYTIYHITYVVYYYKTLSEFLFLSAGEQSIMTVYCLFTNGTAIMPIELNRLVCKRILLFLKAVMFISKHICVCYVPMLITKM